VHLRLRNDSPSFHPVYPLIRAFGPRFLHHVKGRGQSALPDTPEGHLLNLVEKAKAHIRAKGEYPFRVIKNQWGFRKTRLRGMLKNCGKVNVLAALTNLCGFQPQQRFRHWTDAWQGSAPRSRRRRT